MNRSFPNIEYRPFPGHKHRVGYAGGHVWHIQRITTNGTTKYLCTNQTTGERFYRKTLAEVSIRLTYEGEQTK